MANFNVTTATSAAIETAYASATWGDTITLTAGVTYVGTVDFAYKPGFAGTKIKLRSTPNVGLPVDGVRVDRVTHPALMAKIQPVQASGNQNDPCIRFGVGCVGVEVEHVEFMQSFYGSGNMVEVGNNNSSFTLRAHQVQHVRIRACYFNGASTRADWRHKRGVSLHGKTVAVEDCYFHNLGCPTNTYDSQCIWMQNGEGPYLVDNNYLEGTTMQILTGGDQSYIVGIGTIQASPAPTTTSCRVVITNGGDPPIVGQSVAITSASSTWNTHPDLTGVTFVSANTYDLAFAVPIDTGAKATPTVGADIRWAVMPTDITVTNNYFFKPPEQMEEYVVPMPASISATPGVGGTLAAGSYQYRVAARLTAIGTVISSNATTTATVTVAATGKIDVSWAAVTNAADYRLYVNDGAGWRYKTVTGTSTSYTAPGSTVSYVPSGNKVAVKNSFEIKCGINITVQNNRFVNCWPGVGSGYMIWIKCTNPSAGSNASSYMQARNILFDGNVLHSTAGFFLISGNEVVADNAKRPGMMKGLTISNNLCYDSGGAAWTQGQTMYALNLSAGCDQCTFDHNTIIHSLSGVTSLDLNPGSENMWTDLVFTNNITVKNTHGWKGQRAAYTVLRGTPAFEAHCDGYTWQRNVMSSGSAVSEGTGDQQYPVGGNCLFPLTASFQADYFENYAANDFRLKPGSPAIGAGTSGSDIGVDAEAVLLATEPVLLGITPTSGTPEIVTLTLPDGFEGDPYSQQIAVSGGEAPYTYAVTVGAVPTGLTLSGSGLLSGTLSTDGTFTFSVRVTDNNTTVSAPMAYQIIVANVEPESPTRYGLPSSGTANISPAFNPAGTGTGWNTTASSLRLNLVTAKIGSPKVSRTIGGTALTPEFQLAHQFIGPPLDAQTIGGTCSGVVMCRENNVTVGGTLALRVRVVSSDGTHLAFLTNGGTEVPVASDNTSTTPPEFETGSAPGSNRQFQDATETTTIPLTPYTCAQGDRLVVDVGGRNIDTSTSSTMIIRFGDNATDCAFDSTGGTDLDPWIEFSHEFAMQPPPPIAVGGGAGSLYRWSYTSTDAQ